MMGANHAITGAAAWVAVTSTATGALGLVPMEPGEMLVGMLVAAGAALLPDADHPNATIAHSVPLIGSAGASAVSGMVGGHRHGTHSLLSIPVIALIAWVLQFGTASVTWWERPIAWAPAIAVVALVCFAAKAMKLVVSWPKAWVSGAMVGALVLLFAPEDPFWLQLAIVLGFVIHLAGDMLTVGGLPLLWPWNPKPPNAWRKTPIRYFWMPNGYFALPVLGKTGSVLEWILGAAVTAYLAWVLIGTFVG